MSSLNYKSTFLFIFLSAIISLTPSLYAATILQVGTSSLVNESELIFEGEVVSTRSEHILNGYIYTYVGFLVLDVLTGEIEAGSTIELRFTGGTFGDVTLDVGSEIPLLGERGIYFVEGVDKKLINPLLGWSQGHFKIQDNKLVTENGRVVVGIIGDNTNSIALSDGIAKGVMTYISGDTGEVIGDKKKINPINIDEFKRIIKTLKE